jgi:hypothetical protein
MSFSKNIESVEIFDVEGQGGVFSCPYRSQRMMYRILFESRRIQFDLGRSHISEIFRIRLNTHLLQHLLRSKNLTTLSVEVNKRKIDKERNRKKEML